MLELVVLLLTVLRILARVLSRFVAVLAGLTSLLLPEFFLAIVLLGKVLLIVVASHVGGRLILEMLGVSVVVTHGC